MSDDFLNALKSEIRSKNLKGQNPSGKIPPVGNVENHEEPLMLEDEIAEFQKHRVIEPMWKPELPAAMPEIKTDVVAGKVPLSEQQKRNICTIAYSLATRNLVIEPPAIFHLWPVEGDPYKLRRAGKRPSITGIQQFICTEEYAERMGERGIDISPADQQTLMPEQIALISILNDTSSNLGLRARLKKAGVSWPVYNGWRRQKPFADAMSQAAGGALSDAVEHADVQLAQMAVNGDLKAIQYLNDMVGRGPNNRKAVDAIQFARIVLEAVQRHVSPDQARSISSEIELASKQLGIGA